MSHIPAILELGDDKIICFTKVHACIILSNWEEQCIKPTNVWFSNIKVSVWRKDACFNEFWIRLKKKQYRTGQIIAVSHDHDGDSNMNTWIRICRFKEQLFVKLHLHLNYIPMNVWHRHITCAGKNNEIYNPVLHKHTNNPTKSRNLSLKYKVSLTLTAPLYFHSCKL